VSHADAQARIGVAASARVDGGRRRTHPPEHTAANEVGAVLGPEDAVLLHPAAQAGFRLKRETRICMIAAAARSPAAGPAELARHVADT